MRFHERGRKKALEAVPVSSLRDGECFATLLLVSSMQIDVCTECFIPRFGALWLFEMGYLYVHFFFCFFA